MRNVTTPSEIATALQDGAALAISLSGGKDSQAMLNAVMAERSARDWSGPVFGIHADLGRAEWPQSRSHCEAICEDAGIELIIVERTQGDLVDRLWDRLGKLEGTGKPFWPSAANRYCTSDLKRNPINKHLRKFSAVVSAEGIRSEESASRCNKPLWEVRGAIQTLSRNAYTWNPIKEWTLADVWEACGTSAADVDRRRQLHREGRQTEAFDGWGMHPAYIFGNERVSCALCVLATLNDLRIGAQHNPALLAEYLEMEAKSGFTFKQNFSLKEL